MRIEESFCKINLNRISTALKKTPFSGKKENNIKVLMKKGIYHCFKN